MKRWLFALMTLIIATPTFAAEVPVCAALETLRAEVRSSHEPARIAVFNTVPESVACRRGNTAAQADLCSAVMPSLGIEQMHRFPWLIRDCLNQAGIPSYTEQVDQQTMLKNRKKITHLWAGWRDGGRIDIRFRSADTSGTHDRYSDYFGTYELTIWYP